MGNGVEISKKPMYGNYKVYHPKGHLMFYCDLKKFNWYLDRNLAVLLDEPKSIQLTFEPKGDGEKPRFLSGLRRNICVVSGSEDNLTKHHVVPTQYRKHFPEIYKSKNSNDVVAIENDIHNEYEKIADLYKEELIRVYITDEEIEYNRILSCVNRLCITLNKYGHLIPDDRYVDLFNRLDHFLINLNISLDEAKDLNEINYSELIVDRMGVEELIISWKRHFVEHTDPQYLPKWWDPDYVKIIDIRK